VVAVVLAAPQPELAPDQEPSVPEGLLADFDCAVRCAGLTASERSAVEVLYRQAGCGSPSDASASASPVCASSVEQLCAGSCGGGQVNMGGWLPSAFGPGARGAAARTPELRRAYSEHRRCSARCAEEGVALAVEGPPGEVARRAAETLRRCGVVQLLGASDAGLLERAERAVAALRAKKKAYRALLDREQLHDGRYQLYLPFAEPFTSRSVLGASELVLSVLEDYFAGQSFGIDHVSVLTAGSPSGNQSLHPDVAYFKGLAVSVHTALQDITLDMGPTYFCPCTGEALLREEWPASAAIKMALLKSRECLGRAHAPALTPRGTVTIYDGAMFHKGLANGSGRDRHILKLELGALDFPARRNYVGTAPRAAQRQAARFAKAFGPPRMGPRSVDGARAEL